MASHLPIITVVLTLVSVSQGQLVCGTLFPGVCPTVTPQATVALSDLEGTWFEQRRYSSCLENFKRCITSTFITATTTSMTINTVMTDPFSGLESFLGATIRRTGTNGQFTYRITALPGTGLPVNQDYDYKVVAVTADYLVAYSCKNLFLSSEQILWVLTRTRAPTAAVMTAALAAATAQGISTSALIIVDQTGC